MAGQRCQVPVGPTFSNGTPSHCLAYHVVRSVGCNGDKLAKRDLVSFEPIKNKLGKSLSCRRVTNGNEKRELFDVCFESVPHRTGQDMVLTKKWCVEGDWKLLTGVETFLYHTICQTSLVDALAQTRIVTSVYFLCIGNVVFIHKCQNPFMIRLRMSICVLVKESMIKIFLTNREMIADLMARESDEKVFRSFWFSKTFRERSTNFPKSKDLSSKQYSSKQSVIVSTILVLCKLRLSRGTSESRNPGGLAS